MPEKTIKRRLQDCDAALASDDGPPSSRGFSSRLAGCRPKSAMMGEVPNAIGHKLDYDE
jgi:hypothetical protein